MARQSVADVRVVRRGQAGRAPDGSEIKFLDETVASPARVSSFAELLHLKAEVERRLSFVGPRIDVCWPTGLIRTFDGDVDAYRRTAPRDEFWEVDLSRPRSLNFAIAMGDQPDVEISAGHAREVVVLIGTWLHAMHESGLIHGGVAFHNVAYAVEPQPSIAVMDFEASREIGRQSLLGPDHSEELWIDPHLGGNEATQDSDRFQFAVLAFRLLVTRTRNGVIDPALVPMVLEGFDEHETALLGALWTRAQGPRGSRPTMHEWLHALSLHGAAL